MKDRPCQLNASNSRQVTPRFTTITHGPTSRRPWSRNSLAWLQFGDIFSSAHQQSPQPTLRTSHRLIQCHRRFHPSVRNGGSFPTHGGSSSSQLPFHRQLKASLLRPTARATIRSPPNPIAVLTTTILTTMMSLVHFSTPTPLPSSTTQPASSTPP